MRIRRNRPAPHASKNGTIGNVFPEVPGQLYDLLEDQGLLNMRGAFIDGTFSAAKKEARMSAHQKGKGTKIMLMVDVLGTLLAVYSCSASPAEIKRVHDTLEASR